MIKKIREIREAYRIWKTVKNSPGIFKVVEDIFKFVELTHEKQKPMITKIVLLNMANGTKINDFVSLWAGIGDVNPIERVGHLKAQNIELKRLLQMYQDGEVKTEDEKKQIQMILNIFE